MKKVVFILTIALGFFINSNAQATMEKPTGLMAGDKAPNIVSATAKYDLEKALKNGPVVVLFYRGEWCPYCNKQLKSFNDSLQQITAKGATIIAISPETKEASVKTVEKTKISFPIINDDKLMISKAYKVNFSVEPAMVDKLKGYGIDLVKANGANGTNLPVPASYIIGTDMKIKYVYFNPDYSKRVTVKEIIDNL